MDGKPIQRSTDYLEVLRKVAALLVERPESGVVAHLNFPVQWLKSKQ